jgi:glycosyltransferase involved in cell wall biosynthesis
MRIVYLYSELGPYNIPVIRELVTRHGATLLVVHWDRNRLKPFEPPLIEGVEYVRRSEHSADEILSLCRMFNPDAIYVSGWMDRGYLPTAAHFVRRGIPVVAGFDDRWVGTPRQYVAVGVVAPVLRRAFFSHAWVAGPEQYSYARRLGFGENEIIFDLLSADVELFASGERDVDRLAPFFLYAGNYRTVKGTDILLAAFAKYRAEVRDGWRLVCAGGGEMAPDVKSACAVEDVGFLDQPSLCSLARRAGVFVLPSRHDQWGVVVHEFAAMGLPLLLSSGVGASASFLIAGWNGVRVEAGSVESLVEGFVSLSRRSWEELESMGRRSRALATRITPTTSAANFAALVRGGKRA